MSPEMEYGEWDAEQINPHFGQNQFSIKGAAVGFPGGAVVENLPANAGDTGSSPGLGRSHMPWKIGRAHV